MAQKAVGSNNLWRVTAVQTLGRVQSAIEAGGLSIFHGCEFAGFTLAIVGSIGNHF